MVAWAVLALALFGFYLSWRATRLHRLHHRVDVARAGLEGALARRRSAVLALAGAGCVPREGCRALEEAVAAAGEAGERRLDLAESRLSRVLRDVVEGTGAGDAASAHPVHAEVEAAAKGVHIARTFYNDAVSDTRRARRSRIVRVFRLAGTAPLPDYFEIDDRPPRTAPPTVRPDTL
ncbi:hypothetical protein [Nocardiopsis tropica]|uniref:LemA family protein n=1 Tax=Nocardiopsis tropica TaxID=109330 RepID=A0ABU7KW02_9ACTN|nr:hypothetical protein [Nocardiopsis umidischolae]MEE2053483.1 hypothetical protein [Nocardiopsis umidischolae]